jgi:hypothetical protein
LRQALTRVIVGEFLLTMCAHWLCALTSCLSKATLARGRSSW